MNENDIILMIGAALVAGFLIYININKLAPKLDVGINKYLVFCEQILKEIDEISTLCDDNNDLVAIKSKIKLITQFHANNNNSQIWEEKLFEVLSDLDKFIKTNIKDGEKIADELRSRLQSKFNQI
nr:hypothetical protein [Campylobacter sp.]